MKKLILMTALLFSVSTVAAPSKTRVMSVSNTKIELKLNAETVKCSHADYSAPFLKILIPELAELTFLDHRNFGEGAPCVAAGSCFQPNNMPADILDELKPTENVKIVITLSKVTREDEEKEICHVSLQEDVLVNVRGKDFRHRRFKDLGQRALVDCK